MGMYDHIEVQVPLPDGWTPPKGALQSKDFDCTMQTLTITDEGRLVTDSRNWWDGIDADRDGPKPEPTRTDLDFHGWFHFHGDEGRPDGSSGMISGGSWRDAAGEAVAPFVMHEYRAKFTDGVLQEIVLVAEIHPIRFAAPEGR